MTATISTVPSSPSKIAEVEEINRTINAIFQKLYDDWGLHFRPRSPTDSPNKRQLQVTTLEQEHVAKCEDKIKYLYFKRKNTLSIALGKFDSEAKTLCSAWIKKPNAEPDVVPRRTGNTPYSLSAEERHQLLQCLLNILNSEINRFDSLSKASPSSLRSKTGNSVSINDALQSRHSASIAREFNDGPVPFSLTPNRRRDSKRLLESFPDNELIFKKPRIPESADTSFASNVSSVFSRESVNGSNSSFYAQSTQDTVLDDDDPGLHNKDTTEIFKASGFEQNQSLVYEEAGKFDAASPVAVYPNPQLADADPTNGNLVNANLSQDLMDCTINDNLGNKSAKEKFRECLEGIFPELPLSLANSPFFVIYEITRVFLHVGVPLSEFKFPIASSMDDYESLWNFLKNLEVLKGKSFPEKCGQDVWSSAFQEYRRGFRGVVLRATLRFSSSASGHQFFRFQLEPMKLDLRHRLGRHFGDDRFFELDIPNLTGRRLPELLADLGDQRRAVVIEWLVDGTHKLFGRTWKPFHVKAKDLKNRKVDLDPKISSEPDTGTSHRVFFFATDGRGFCAAKSSSGPTDSFGGHIQMSISQMLNWIRPTELNKAESFLKLFARTSLALSRNHDTVVLERPQIRYKRDIFYCGENMTDGGGRISPVLALKVGQKLGLSYPPSGFQGRIGEAKGFWSVNYRDKSNDEWIDIFDSQRKWTRSQEDNRNESDDSSNRTFEVLQFSGPLKSADLNLQFLPLLINRAILPRQMRSTLGRLLELGLDNEFEAQRLAMGDPLQFRKWIRETNPGIKDRLKTGSVAYTAGLPSSIEERLNVLLDAGFQPTQCHFLQEMARTVFRNKCDKLKQRLNIKISASTYAYMVPDFQGVLEPNEVYLDFSSFVDEKSGFSGVLLDGVDVLVARNPAHFVSDMQKVKAVFKVELIGLKDVIVFSTKGNPSLAQKLSGGDYDGDMAWVCWEPTIVDNFCNADIPHCPDLVKGGFISKDNTSYESLVEGQMDPASVFLKRSFAFNLQPNLLGVCTKFKERLCYKLGTIGSDQAVFMSTLLGLLVDQEKQGYTFTEEDFKLIKSTKIKEIIVKPAYETAELDRRSRHIIDRLMCIASDAVDKKLADFHKTFPEAPHWDDDIVKFHRWSREMATPGSELESLLMKLDEDIIALKAIWRDHFARDRNDETKSSFVPFIIGLHEKFQAILPAEDTPSTTFLLPRCLPDPNLSHWALLKASAAFDSYPKSYSRNFVWWVAGKQLAQLKTTYSGQGMVTVAPNMYTMLKPDATYVRLFTNQNDQLYFESKNIEDHNDLDDRDDMKDD